MGLAYLRWWSEDQDEAVSEFARAVELAPNDAGLQFDYPEAANDFYDAGAINVVRQAFELYQHDDLLSDLLSHFESQADHAPNAERLWWRMGLAYLRWWSEDQDEAVAEFARAVELAPNDAGLQFELASLHERRQDYFAALGVVDGIVPLAHEILRRGGTASTSRGARVAGSAGGQGAAGGDETARQQALGVLSKSGRLDDLIARAETQLAASPASVHLLQTLVEYYRAAGRQ